MSKKQYRVRNWREYNEALRRRGSLTVWVDEAAVSGWLCEQKSGKRGASRCYSEDAIQCALTLGSVYGLPLRGTVGLLSSVFELMSVALPVPDFSTLSRRREGLEVELGARLSRGGVHLVVDASGFKVFGEGEWKVRQHGYSKRRTWRKLHMGSDEATGEIVSAVVTTNDFRDDEVLGDLLEAVPLGTGGTDDAKATYLAQVSGDGIYDSAGSYKEVEKRSARAVFPPRRGARRADLEQKPHLAQRNAHIERIQELEQQAGDGRKRWKEETNYHRRSLVETDFFRLKTIFGNALGARLFDSQATELFIRCAALNRMTQLGMPQSYAR